MGDREGVAAEVTKLCECGCNPPVSYGFCHCRCGSPAPIAAYTSRTRGWVKDLPKRFIYNHHRRGKPGTRTCGKKHGSFRHGAYRTPEYRVYAGAKSRCTDPNSKRWKDYGGRGIKFLFTSFEQFIAELGPRPSPEQSVDRIDNDGPYAPGNIRWATRSEQQNNRRDNRRLKAA